MTITLEVWTIYKEVAQYYAQGLNPPEDVTLMFTDDNWGNIQRLPSEEERQRSGGIGVSSRFMLLLLFREADEINLQMYYHFNYVGRPKSWKWQNCINIVSYKHIFHLLFNHHFLTQSSRVAQDIQRVLSSI